ncbi:hypothetical protein HHI36_015586 [Cryptolaemus montrouzieri]|uniref:Uncharacterized protein n=1 Tax=Cryptolaemus montrouzieri TaxID=559131 RepID=A0ABD2N661_9CUCU
MKIAKKTLSRFNPELICLTWKTQRGAICRWNDECCPRYKIKKRTSQSEQSCSLTKCAGLDESLCHPTLKTAITESIWECRIPDPNVSCGGTNREIDPRCMPIVGGYSHPHVVMFDDYSYYVQIDFPEMY